MRTKWSCFAAAVRQTCGVRHAFSASRLVAGDEIRVIAPSRSLAIIPAAIREIADARFAAAEFRLSFGEHVDEDDRFGSASVEHRVADIHAAFSDPDIKAILTAIGGYNSNQLLPYLDWDLIEANPKVFCGYSDITALSCAIHARTGLVTYSGPHYSTFGMRDHFEQTQRWFDAAIRSHQPVVVEAARTWTDDCWYLDQDARTYRPNDGHWVLGEGRAEGRLIGGNLCTLNLLHGTEFMPDLREAIVFVEDDSESSIVTFDRDLTSLTQQCGFDQVRGLLIGRFQLTVEMTAEILSDVLKSKRELARMPIIANVDFGHTDPMLTIPIGGTATIEARDGTTSLVLSD